MEECVQPRGGLGAAAQSVEQAMHVERYHPQVLRSGPLDESVVGGRRERGPGTVGIAVLDVTAVCARVRIEQVAPITRAGEEQRVACIVAYRAGELRQREI